MLTGNLTIKSSLILAIGSIICAIITGPLVYFITISGAKNANTIAEPPKTVSESPKIAEPQRIIIQNSPIVPPDIIYKGDKDNLLIFKFHLLAGQKKKIDIKGWNININLLDVRDEIMESGTNKTKLAAIIRVTGITFLKSDLGAVRLENNKFAISTRGNTNFPNEGIYLNWITLTNLEYFNLNIIHIDKFNKSAEILVVCLKSFFKDNIIKEE